MSAIDRETLKAAAQNVSDSDVAALNRYLSLLEPNVFLDFMAEVQKMCDGLEIASTALDDINTIASARHGTEIEDAVFAIRSTAGEALGKVRKILKEVE